MTIGVIIQARTGSTRLPYKVCKPLGDSTVLGQIIKRCRNVGQRYNVILAVPEKDLFELGAIADLFGVSTFGGSENDVLDRYYQCAKKYELTHIVRITADCPFVDPDIIRLVSDVLLNNPQYDYVSNVGVRTWPKGLDVEAFTFEALAYAKRCCASPYDLEHVTVWLRSDDAYRISCANLRCPIPGIRNLRFVIDYPSDLEFARKVWPLLPANFGWRDILSVLQSHPEISNPREEKAA